MDKFDNRNFMFATDKKAEYFHEHFSLFRYALQVFFLSRKQTLIFAKMLNANFPFSATPDVLKAILKKRKILWAKVNFFLKNLQYPFAFPGMLQIYQSLIKKRAKSCQLVEHGEPLY
jgi:hypothetical protein